jgi:diguanylate cyclase (GGDEF)-like protein
MALVYPQLARAESGHSDVSDAVSSTTDGQPMVAFAVPFSTAHGRRVLSVEFPASETPLGQYSDHLLTIPGHRTYIVDGNGTLIAGSRSTAVGTTLSHVDPPIARALRSAPTGTEGSGSSRQVFVSSKVPGTPWTMAASEPADQLFASVDGPGHSLAWLALAGLSLAGLIIIAITARLARSRTRLLELTRELERLARIDSLTSVSNRRDLEERLAAAACAANRNGSPMSVLLVDIDRFKCVNDTLGHQRGDEVLIATASAMHASLRANDVIGRWGGEEFLAILPDTDLEGAAVVAERLRQRVRTTVAAGDRPVTVTIGVAGLDERGVSALVARADTALYAGKAAGRDTVEVSAGSPADEPTVLTPALV